MARRKSSIIGGGKAPGEQPATPAMDQATLDAINKDHREQLLRGRPALEITVMPPPAKKRKSSAKKQKKDCDEIEDAKTGESAPGTPRNATTSTKGPKVTPKERRESVSTSTDDSPESKKSVGSKHDSVLQSEEATAPPQATKAKATSKKRKAAEQNPAADDNASPSKKTKATPKKRKTAGQDASLINQDATDGASRPKKRKSASSKKKDNNALFRTTHLLPPRPKPLTTIVATKVNRIQAFITSEAEHDSVLARDEHNPSCISIPERQLLAALMRLRADYEVGNIYEAHLSDLPASITARFTAAYKQAATEVAWVTFDAEAPASDLESEIQEKIEGHGLEDVNLLEIELELLERQERQAMAFAAVPEKGKAGWEPEVRISAPEAMQAFFTKTWEGVLAKEAQQAVEKAAEEEIQLESQAAWMNRKDSKGVCPRPMVPV